MAAEQPETRPQQSAETANTITNELLRRLLRQQKLQTERKRRRVTDWIALCTAIGALGAAGVAIWSVTVTSQANLTSEQQQLLTLTTNIVEQIANHQATDSHATAGSTSSSQAAAAASTGAEYTAQLGAEGESAQVLIAELHGSGVTSIEYVWVGQALNTGGDSGVALADLIAGTTAPPHTPPTIAAAWRLAGNLEYELGHFFAGHNDMMLAVKAFNGSQPYVTAFSINANQAQTLYDDAEHLLRYANNCTMASRETAEAAQFLAALGGMPNAPPPIPLEFQEVQSLYKQHCSRSKS